MAGRKPKPTNLKILQGNPGGRPLNMSEPSPVSAIPNPPQHLNTIALEEWERITGELYPLGLLSEIDMPALAAYCQCFARWVEAEEGIKKSGLIIKTTNGNAIQSPLVGISNTALQMMHKFLTEFGMTPVSRAKVTPNAQGESGNKFAKHGRR